MSDVPEQPGWWQASDGKWYPPEQFPASASTVSPPFNAGPETPQPQPQTPPQFQPTQPAGQAQYPGQYPTPQYPTPGSYGQPVPAGPKTDGMAIASLVCALVGFVLWFACFIGFFATVAAIPLGFISRKKIRESGGQLTGDGMAMAGIIVGSITTVLGIAFFVFYLLVIVAAGSSGS